MLALLFSFACNEGSTASSAQAAVTSIKTGTVTAASWQPTIELTGSVEPIAMVQLGFDVPGRIDAILVERGQPVRAGQPIARLDARMAKAQYEQAKAALEGAQAQLLAGELAWARVEKLKAAGGVSDQQYTDTRAQIEAGRAGVQQAEAAVRMARTHLSNHTLTSPLHGILTNAPDNAGIMVGAGTPMFLIEDLSALQLKGLVDETASWVTAGATATVTSGSPAIPVTASASVTRVIPSLDMATRRIPVELQIISPPSALKAHSFARALITGTTPLPAFTIPKNALVARPEFSVFVVATPDAPPSRVPVSVLDSSGTDTILVAGALSDGALVVLDPAYSYGIE
jgi:RND family efflux transporter MFP subunit